MASKKAAAKKAPAKKAKKVDEVVEVVEIDSEMTVDKAKELYVAARAAAKDAYAYIDTVRKAVAERRHGDVASRKAEANAEKAAKLRERIAKLEGMAV